MKLVIFKLEIEAIYACMLLIEEIQKYVDDKEHLSCEADALLLLVEMKPE